MDSLTIFGLVAVSLMLVCYALEARSSWFVFGFAGVRPASAAVGLGDCAAAALADAKAAPHRMRWRLEIFTGRLLGAGCNFGVPPAQSSVHPSFTRCPSVIPTGAV